MDQAPSSDTDVRPTTGGVLLAGPPASGKRTVAFALSALRRRYTHVPALTTAAHPILSAQHTPQEHLDELRSWAQLFYEFSAENARYAHDRERLDTIRSRGRIPVVCVEDVDAVTAFERESANWIPVLLWCPRDHAEDRLTRGRSPSERATIITRSWTRRWDRSFTALDRGAHRFTMALRSDRLDGVEIARIVHLAAQAGAGPE